MPSRRDPRAGEPSPVPGIGRRGERWPETSRPGENYYILLIGGAPQLIDGVEPFLGPPDKADAVSILDIEPDLGVGRPRKKWGQNESAGINRHRVGDGSSPHERSS